MGAGRPTSFKAEYVEQGRKLAERGMTDQEMAGFWGVSKRTVEIWKIAHPEFGDSLRVGKEVPDERVKRSLYQRAVGYSYDAVKIFCQNGQVTEVPYVEHIPPDTTACIFWLKNRDRANWRDKVDHEHEGNVTVQTINFADIMTKAEKPANAA